MKEKAPEHTPLRPVRQGFIGEVVFYEEWLKLMDTPYDYANNGQLGAILYPLTGYSMPSQREASVTASFIVWLGTNCGRCFLESTERFATDMAANGKTHYKREDAYVAWWAMENHRRTWLNHGWRYIDGVLSESTNPGARLPEVSYDDCEVIEHVVHWLGTDDGRQFVKGCNAAIKARMRARDAMAA